MEEFMMKQLEGFPYFKFTIGCVIADYMLELYINLRQRSQLMDKNIPEQVKFIGTTQEKFEESNNYAKDKMEYGLIKGLYSLLKGLAELYFFFNPFLWKLCIPILEKMGMDESNHYAHQLVFTVIQALVSGVLDIPWSLYYDFVLEAKWGFNKKTFGLFCSDFVKDQLINMVLTVPLMWVVLVLIDWAGPLWYIFVWAFVSAFILVMMWIYPNFIQPCYNKVEELEAGEVRTAIEELASSLDFPLKGLYQIDGSKRSGHSNAYMYGFCSNKRIVLFDTILKQMNTKEVVAVLGHELGHWKFWHTVLQLVKLEVQMFFFFFVMGFFLNDLHMYQEFGFDQKITLVGFSLAAFMFTPLMAILKFLSNYWTRQMEYQADRFAVDLGYGEGLRTGLLILSEENKSALNPDWLYATYNYSHPAIVSRLAAIDDRMKKVGKKTN